MLVQLKRMRNLGSRGKYLGKCQLVRQKLLRLGIHITLYVFGYNTIAGLSKSFFPYNVFYLLVQPIQKWKKDKQQGMFLLLMQTGYSSICLCIEQKAVKNCDVWLPSGTTDKNKGEAEFESNKCHRYLWLGAKSAKFLEQHFLTLCVNHSHTRQ